MDHVDICRLSNPNHCNIATFHPHYIVQFSFTTNNGADLQSTPCMPPIWASNNKYDTQHAQLIVSHVPPHKHEIGTLKCRRLLIANHLN